jgi:hypothetical protein
MVSSIGSGAGLADLAAVAADPFGVAVLRKALDATAVASLQLLRTMPAPVDPHRGSTFDVLA